MARRRDRIEFINFLGRKILLFRPVVVDVALSRWALTCERRHGPYNEVGLTLRRYTMSSYVEGT